MIGNLTGITGRSIYKDVIGLEPIKDFLDIQISRVHKALRDEEPLDPKYRKHIVIDGDHGIGKHYAAKMIIDTYYELGILKNNKYSNVNSILHAFNIYKMQEDKENAVIFEVGDGTQKLGSLDYIRFDKSELLIIFIGTPTGIKTFYDNNPQLLGRIPIANHIRLKPPTIRQMTEVALRDIKKRNFTISDETAKLIPEAIQALNVSSSFSYYRSVLNLTQMFIDNYNKRIHDTNGVDDNTLQDEDIYDYAHRSDEKSLSELIDELNDSIGLEQCKARVQEIVAMKQMIDEYERRGMDKPPIPTLHMIFSGNAGTGKTTTAEIISKIYKKVGILPRANVVFATRLDFIAKYTGQTIDKTKKLIDKAMGGILFVDEAYGLVQGEQDMYGHEAIEVLIKEMEDHRSDIMVILAGYTPEMNKFLSSNQGLSSRFPITNRVEFRDYTDNELTEIYKRMAKNRHLTIQGVSDKELKAMIVEQKNSSPDFGNARGVRNLVERAEQNHNVRLMKNRAYSKLSDEELQIINREDILNEKTDATPEEITEHRVYLDVPYDDKDEAKALGARWDMDKRSWYVPSGMDINKFNKWRK